MIIANFKRNRNNIVSFDIKGHSGYAEEGNDIFCSAVSALSLSIANGITDILYVNADVKSNEDGFLHLSVKHNSVEDISKCQVLLETLLLGLKSIEDESVEKYKTPYIKVFEEEV